MFPDKEPAELYEVYKQVGRNKQLLIETMLNGGAVPPQLQAHPPNGMLGQDLGDEQNLENMVLGDGEEMSEDAIAAQIAAIERRTSQIEAAKAIQDARE